MANSAVRPHVTDDELHAYCDGELSPSQRVEIAEHLLGCLICRAAHAEVEELRTRASSLLAMAAPRTIRAPAMPAVASPRRRQIPRLAAIAATAVIGAGVWMSVRSHNAPQLASAAIVPTIRSAAPVAPLSKLDRELEIAITPKLAASQPIADDLADPIAEVDPILLGRWDLPSWDVALQTAHGSLARVADLTVASVHMRAERDGGRPVFMIRQLLGDGRPVWVVEGRPQEVIAVEQQLGKDGFALSNTLKTRPDYVTTDSLASRPERMVTVAGRLPADSLNALAAKLRLH